MSKRLKDILWDIRFKQKKKKVELSSLESLGYKILENGMDLNIITEE